jgi:LPXTG-motif cell wall-anchored protein
MKNFWKRRIAPLLSIALVITLVAVTVPAAQAANVEEQSVSAEDGKIVAAQGQTINIIPQLTGGGGTLTINKKSYTSYSPVSVPADEETTLKFVPQVGLTVKSITLNGADIKSQILNRGYISPGFSEDQTLVIIYEIETTNPGEPPKPIIGFEDGPFWTTFLVGGGLLAVGAGLFAALPLGAALLALPPVAIAWLLKEATKRLVDETTTTEKPTTTEATETSESPTTTEIETTTETSTTTRVSTTKPSTTNIVEIETPETGDSLHALPVVIATLMALAGILVLVLLRRKRDVTYS